MKVLSLNRLGLVSDELDKMSPKKLLISLVCGAISGVIVAWLVLKFLESEGSQVRGGHKEMKELKDERDDRNNPAAKLPEENDDRPKKRAQEHEERL